MLGETLQKEELNMRCKIIFCWISRRNQNRSDDMKRCLHFCGIVAILALGLIGGSARAAWMNTDVTNTTGNVANDFHLVLESDNPINIANTYNFGSPPADVSFPDTDVSGSGTNDVTISWSGATVNSGQDTHVGFYAPGNLDVKVKKCIWTFGGLEILPRNLGMPSAEFDGVGTDYLVVRVNLWDGNDDPNLVGTMWWEGQGSTAIIGNFSDHATYASLAFRDPGPMIPLEDLNHTLGGFGSETDIVEIVPEIAPSGSLTTYFHQHDGDANSINIDLGGGSVSTGPISFELNPSDPNSYEIFNFDTMTVIEESDVLVSAPGLGLVGGNRLAVHISEAGTITSIDPNTFIPGVETYFEMTTDLTGEIIIPPGSPFEGFTWTNEKIQILRGYITIDEDGRIEIGFEWVKEIAVSGEITPPGQDPIPLDIAGIGLLRSYPAPDLCDYLLLVGDVDGDCKVGLSDLALISGNWLIDCDLTPLEPACAP